MKFLAFSQTKLGNSLSLFANGLGGLMATSLLVTYFVLQNTASNPVKKNRAKPEKQKDFERKGNRWLEPCRNFILSSNQAKIVALQGNFSEKKDFLKKIGSNLILQNKKVFVEYENPWKLLENSCAETRGKAPSETRNQNFTNWLRVVDSNSS